MTGFILSVLKTMRDLANPNLAICGQISDGTFRDVRNFPRATLLKDAVVIRMDARLSFANARKLKEFCSRAVQVQQQQGHEVRFVIIDAKSINHVDLTGCEMLETLAVTLESLGLGLVIANLKGPVSKCLSLADAPAHIRKHGGHLCIDMEQAIAIVNGTDPEGIVGFNSTRDLVKRVSTAELQLSTGIGGPFCGKVCTDPCSNSNLSQRSTTRSRSDLSAEQRV